MMKNPAALILTAMVLLSCSKEVKPVITVEEGALPAVVSGLIDGFRSGDAAYLDNWMRAHRDTRMPIVVDGTITFLYYETNPAAPIEKVSLVSVWNGYEKDKLFLHRVGDTGLFYLTIRAEMTNEPYYYFSVIRTGEETGKKQLDPFNRSMIYTTTFKSVVREASDPRGFIEVYRQIRPETEIATLQKRDVSVFLPPGYYDDTNRRYPVLYMQDGQNVWDSTSANYGGWKMDTTLVRLMQEGKVEPVIIVGINNTSDRSYEYVGFSTFYNKAIPAGREQETGSRIKFSYAYEDFVLHQVKPMIDANYRTLGDREHTGVAGSSFGAGISLFLAFRNPNVFGKVAALSGGNYPADQAGFDQKPFNAFPFLIDKVVKKNTGLKIYLDCGNQDLDAVFLPRTREMHEALLRLGYREGVDLMYYEAAGRGHNEQTWALAAPQFLEFLFPAR